MNITDLTLDELRQLVVQAEQEIEQRERVAAARAAVDTAMQAYADSQGLTVLQAWRALAPEGVEVPDDPEPEPVLDAPEWEQRYGHNPYQVGDLVTYKGHVYRNVWEGNTYSPDAYPQGWQKIA